MTHEELATKLFAEKYHCSQAVLGAFSEEFGMDMIAELVLEL